MMPHDNSPPATPPLDRVRAVASFFRDDPARILVVASSLRAANRALESTVQGNSMGGTIPPGSRIRIELVKRDRYDTGEVVAFLAGSQVVVHRVVHRGERGAASGYLLTRGDATLTPDVPLDRGCILGAVTGIQREGRWMALDPRPRRSFRARVIASLLLLATASVLRIGPRAAGKLVGLLHRSERSFRRARGRMRIGPRGSVRPGAA